MSWARQRGRISYNLNYTWSKSLGTQGQGGGAGSGQPPDATNYHHDYGVLATDRSHVVNLSYTSRLAIQSWNKFLQGAANGGTFQESPLGKAAPILQEQGASSGASSDYGLNVVVVFWIPRATRLLSLAIRGLERQMSACSRPFCGPHRSPTCASVHQYELLRNARTRNQRHVPIAVCSRSCLLQQRFGSIQDVQAHREAGHGISCFGLQLLESPAGFVPNRQWRSQTDFNASSPANGVYNFANASAAATPPPGVSTLGTRMYIRLTPSTRYGKRIMEFSLKYSF